MATTLVGIFDSASDASRARDYLLKEGLPRNAVHVTDNQSMTSRSGSTEGEHRGFFARLFAGFGDMPGHHHAPVAAVDLLAVLFR